MGALKLDQFGGMLPAWDAHLLPNGQAAASLNGYLFSGHLEGWRAPKVLRTLTNQQASMAFRIPALSQAQSHAYLVFVANPAPGDQVTVGDLTYTFVTALHNPQDVLIGASAAATSVNFTAAVTADSNQNTNSGVLYGAGTSPNGDVYYILPNTTPIFGLTPVTQGTVQIGATQYPYVYVGAPDFGTAFNLVNVSTTAAARIPWLFDLLALAHTTLFYVGGVNQAFNSSITGPATWLEFVDPDTNVLKSPIAQDEFNRYYFASPSMMPEYNTTARIAAGQPPWLLGVPPPGCAPTVSVTGGGNSLTLGNVTQTGPDTTILGNQIYLVPFTPTGTTQIQDVQFNLGSSGVTDSTTRWAAVIYEDQGGKPSQLLNTGVIQRGVNTSGNVSPFVNPTTLNVDIQYWLGIIIDTQNNFAGGATNGQSFADTFANGPAGTAPATTARPGAQIWGDFVTSDVIESRAYVYTWVSAYNEEGPPSPPTLLDGWSNGVWTVGLFTPPPDDLGVLRNLQSINLYRTVPGTGGSTVFFFVANIPIGTATYVDSNPDNTVALNNQLTSTNWFPPPANLQGLIAMQNGMIAGFTDNEIWFCEPFRPHAWPPGYVLTSDFPVVGLGLTNGALVVCTASNPYIISGTAPGSMAMLKCSLPNPCLSRGSILSGDQAVTYCSPNGLIQVQSTGVALNTTDLWFTRENWQQLTPQLYPRAIFLASCYYCLGSVSPPSVSPQDTSQAQSGFTIELDQDNTSFTIWPQPGGHRLGFNQLNSPTGANIQNVFTDPWTGIALLISNGNIYYFDFTDPKPIMLPYAWTSKIYQQNAKQSYSAMKVWFTTSPTTPGQGSIPNENVPSDPSWASLPANAYAYVKTFADVDGTGNMVLVDAREVRVSGGLLRIQSGFKAEQFQWQILSQVKISNIQVATSAKELAKV